MKKGEFVVVFGILLGFCTMSSCDNGESTIQPEHNNDISSPFMNRVANRVDSLIGKWRLTVIEFNEHYRNERGSLQNELIYKKMITGDHSLFVEVKKNGDLLMNDSLVGSWETDSIRSSVTFKGKNIFHDHPVFFDTPYFIGVQPLYRTLTATFMDVNGNHHQVTYSLIYPN